MAKSKGLIEGFWDRFDEALNDTGKSKNFIATQIGCNRKVLYNNYDGRMPSPLYIAKFCSIYHVSSDYLLGIKSKKEEA